MKKTLALFLTCGLLAVSLTPTLTAGGRTYQTVLHFCSPNGPMSYTCATGPWELCLQTNCPPPKPKE